MDTYRYHVIIEPDEDGFYVASCPALQGCHAQGGTYEEALSNIREAMRGYIAARKQLGESPLAETAIEEVEVVA